MSNLGSKGAACYFALLATLFFAPLLWGEAFIEAGFLYKTPLWYDERVGVKQFDEFDSVIATYPYQALLKEGLTTGEFPFWNPYNLGGHPIAFNGQSGMFYPPRIFLVALFPTWLAHGLSQALHVFLAGFGCWLLCKRLKISSQGGLFVGTAWMFNPFIMSWMQMDMSNICAAYTPLCLLGVERCRRDWKGAGWLGLALGLLVLAGHLQSVYYVVFTVLLVGLIMLFYLGFSRVVWWRLGTAGLVAGLLSAPMLLPATHYLSTAQRPRLELDSLLSIYRQFLKTMPPTIIFPEAWGNSNDFAVKRIFGAGEFIYAELCFYFGVVTLILALVSCFTPGLARRLMILAAVVLIIPSTPLYGLIQTLPGLSQVNSTRTIQIIHFLVALSAGFGLDFLSQKKGRILAASFSGLFFVGGVASAYWACNLEPISTLSRLSKLSSLRLPAPETFLSGQDYSFAVLEGFTAVYSWSNPAIFLPLLCLLATCLTCLFLPKPQYFLIGFVIIELFWFGRTYNPHYPHELLFPVNETITQLKKIERERILGLGTIKPNTLMPFSLQDVAGYDSFYPRTSSRYLAYLMFGNDNPERALPQQVFPVRRHKTPLVDLMGVKYIVAYPGQVLEDMPQVQESPLPIFLNPSRLPRAFLVDEYRLEMDDGKALRMIEEGEIDPATTVLLVKEPEIVPETGGTLEARIIGYSFNRVIVHTESSKPALLILTDAFAEGWEVEVDDQSAELMRADVMFRAVCVPAGTHLVSFHFQPKHFRLGLMLGGIGVFLLCGLLVGTGQSIKIHPEF